MVLAETLGKIREFCDACRNVDVKAKVTAWIAKGLVARNHREAWPWTDRLINALSESSAAADGFRIIMSDDSTAISKENHCQIMPLRKQKFFVYVTNRIGDKWPNENPAFFVALGYLMERAPRLALAAQFRKILRPTLACLEGCRQPEVLSIILNRIGDLVAGAEPVVEDHLEDLLLRVLDLTAFEPCMRVRIAAIDCTRKFAAACPTYKLLPFKRKVVRRLGVCVDDKKRLVRKEAMDVRSLWFLLDAPL